MTRIGQWGEGSVDALNAVSVQWTTWVVAAVWQSVLLFAVVSALALFLRRSSPAVRKHIRDKEPHLLLTEILTGRRHQMVAMYNSLLELYQRAEITYDVCLSNARDPDYVRHKAEGA